MPFHGTTSRHDDVEAIVHLAFLDDLFTRVVILPIASAQHFPDFRVRKLVEELESAQHAKLLLAIDASIRLTQALMYARQLCGEVQAALVALGWVFLQRHRHHGLELLGDLFAQRVNRRRCCIHDLMQQLLKVAGAEGPRAGEELVHDGSQRIQIRTVGQIEALHLLRRHVRRATRDAFDARDVGV